MTRKRQEREWNRQFILEHAIAEFARTGYTGTTMEAIAEAAGVSKGTLYNYFANKQELFFSLLSWGMEEIRDIIDEAMAEEAPILEKTRLIVTRFLEVFEKGQDIHKIVMAEGERITLAAHKDLGKMMRDQIMAFVGQLARFVERGQTDGVFRPGDPQKAAFIMLNIITAETKYTLFTGQSGPVAPDADEVTDFVLGALGILNPCTDPIG